MSAGSRASATDKYGRPGSSAFMQGKACCGRSILMIKLYCSQWAVRNAGGRRTMRQQRLQQHYKTSRYNMSPRHDSRDGIYGSLLCINQSDEVSVSFDHSNLHIHMQASSGSRVYFFFARLGS
jgi:hypothetical protein